MLIYFVLVDYTHVTHIEIRANLEGLPLGLGDSCVEPPFNKLRIVCPYKRKNSLSINFLFLFPQLSLFLEDGVGVSQMKRGLFGSKLLVGSME